MLINGFSIDDVLWGNLRACQQESIKTAINYLQKPISDKSCLISLPTGAGKSGVICTLAHFSKHKRVLILCHRRAVCDQLITQLSGDFFTARASSVNMIQKDVFDTVDDLESEGVYVSTFQKLQRMNSNDLKELKDKIDMLIIDEGHSEPSPVWSQLARNLDAHKIIITATPYRNDLFQFDIDSSLSYIYTFKVALTDNILSEPSFSTINETDVITHVKDLLNKQLGSICIVKCNTFENVDHFFNIFYQSFKTLAVHDRYANDVRENVKTSLPKNTVDADWQVLVHQHKLDEGVDIPQAKILVLTYAVASGRELVQTVGRVVRLYKGYNAHVLEFSESNKRMWDNYREFDGYIANPNHAQKFLKSLDTASLIDSYLEVFPDVSYFGSTFKRKFNLKSFDPVNSLIVPLASVCFIQKNAGFTISSMMDKLYWNFEKEGELVEHRQNLFGSQMLLSICFKNSKFLKDELFFQPSLEIFLVKEFNDIVAIYDSRGRDFSNEKDLLLGLSIDVDKLLCLANRSATTRTKEAHTRAISSANLRPEGITIRGADLEKVNGSQGNSSYAITTLKVDNIDKLGVKSSSYYLGVGSGRVADQKNRNFSLKEFCDWIDDIDQALQSGNTNRSELINSYAKHVKETPNDDPLSVLIDFSDCEYNIYLMRNNKLITLSNCFELFNYKNGIFPFNDDYVLMLKLDKNGVLFFDSINDENPPFYYNEKNIGTASPDGRFLDLLNKLTIKVIYPNGISYLDKKFYRVVLPSENGLSIEEMKLSKSIIPLDFLKNNKLTEKDEANVQVDSFGDSSIFYEIDKLKRSRDPSAVIADLGEFHNDIPDIDMMLCTDMGTEPADFILSSKSKLIFVHVKCGDSKRPRSSAGALADVGGQALKNLEMMVSNNTNFSPANMTNLHGAWPTPNTINALKDRVRLFNNKRYDSKQNKLDDVWRLIAERRRSTVVKKEIWVVVGRSFSRKHFISQMKKGHAAQGESLQAFQFIDGWMATAASADVELKFFVSP